MKMLTDNEIQILGAMPARGFTYPSAIAKKLGCKPNTLYAPITRLTANGCLFSIDQSSIVVQGSPPRLYKLTSKGRMKYNVCHRLFAKHDQD